MKYLFINSISGSFSTGKLLQAQCRRLQQEGHKCVIAYGRGTSEASDVESWRIGSNLDNQIHAVATRVLDIHGFASRLATSSFLKRVEAYKPDVVWLQNLHGYYIHVGMLFRWLKAHPEIKVFWTLHDCWAFTGHCPHFTIARCDKWKTQCCNCPQKHVYPTSNFLDNSRRNYQWKKAAFTGVRDLTLITPSQWLAGLTRQSFLQEYPVIVVNNKIDTTLFCPTPSTFRQTHGLTGKKLLLGVATGFEETKGIQDVVQLRAKLDDSYAIVLVGVDDQRARTLPQGILCIPRITDQKELAGLYSTADVFINPTHQDTYPTVNLEARACGTPVVTYNVGGSPESAGWEHVVEENDVDAFAAEIRSVCERV